jgi:hypothetical protein
MIPEQAVEAAAKGERGEIGRSGRATIGAAGSVERFDPEGGTRKGLTPRGSGDRIRLPGFSFNLPVTGFSR